MRVPVFVDKPLSNQFVVSVERAVEQDQGGAAQAFRQCCVHGCAARNVVERIPAIAIGNLEPERIARLRAEGGPRGLVLHVQRDFARNRERLDLKPRHLDTFVKS